MTGNMKTVRMEKQSFDGYYVGTGIEYPGIVVWGESDEELMKRFKDAIPAYEEALQRFGIENKPNKTPSIEIISVEREETG